MLARGRAVADFIDSYKNAMQADAEVEQLVATQVEVLKKSFAAETCDVADVSSTLRALADGGDPLILSSFSVGDRRALATAITSSVSPSAAPKATAISNVSTQVHLSLSVQLLVEARLGLHCQLTVRAREDQHSGQP